MFFSDGFGRAPHVEYAYNLVLFKEIKRFYIYRDIVGTEAFLLNTAGNVVCFMPFGFFLPIISPRFGKWYLIVDSELPSDFEHRDDSARIQGGKF